MKGLGLGWRGKGLGLEVKGEGKGGVCEKTKVLCLS